MVDVQFELGRELDGAIVFEAKQHEAKEVGPIRFDGLWAGVVDGEGCGGAPKRWGVFSVEMVDGQVLVADFERYLTPTERKMLHKRIYYFRDVVSLRTWTVDGKPCKLFSNKH